MADTQGSLFDLDPQLWLDLDEPVAAAPVPSGPLVVAATDGSCSPNPGPAAGAWYVSPDCWGVAPVEGLGTNNIGELAAIRALLRAVPAERPLEIVFDSTYARDCLTVWIRGWSRGGTLAPSQWRRGPQKEPVKNAELIGETAALLTGRTVTWTKAKAHVTVRFGGHALNHEADRLAGEAVAALKNGRPVDRGPGFVLDQVAAAVGPRQVRREVGERSRVTASARPTAPRGPGRGAADAAVGAASAGHLEPNADPVIGL